MRPKQDHGEGSCRQIQTGKHIGKWRVQHYVTLHGGVQKRLSRVFANQRDAKEFLRSLKRDTAVIKHRGAKEATFGDWIEWLIENDWPNTLDPKTLRDRVSRYRRYASEHWGNVPLSQIDPIDVHSYYKALQERGVGQHTCIAIKVILVRAFNQAITPYRRVPPLTNNPFCLDMKNPERRHAIALTPQEAQKALASPKLDNSRRALLGVFLLAGLRLGEAMALSRRQLDMENRRIIIDQAVHVDSSGSQTIGLPKGGKVRVSVMCDTLYNLLLPLTEELASDDFLWSAATENKARMKNLTYATWRRIRVEAKLPSQMSPHDCRLTHINWIEKLCPTVSTTTLKEHVGHSAIGVTEVNYTRPLLPAEENLRVSLDQLFSIRPEEARS